MVRIVALGSDRAQLDTATQACIGQFRRRIKGSDIVAQAWSRLESSERGLTWRRRKGLDWSCSISMVTVRQERTGMF